MKAREQIIQLEDLSFQSFFFFSKINLKQLLYIHIKIQVHRLSAESLEVTG